MGRPPNTIPTETRHISLDANLWLWIDMYLYDPIEGKVPRGEYQRFFTDLVKAKQGQEKAA